MGAQAFACASFIRVDDRPPSFSLSAPYHNFGTPMKTARFLLACAVASVLAACGTDPITAPAADAHRAAPQSPSADATSCVKKTIVNADGITVEVCVEDRSSQMGSGS
jgi:hypothetical protein